MKTDLLREKDVRVNTKFDARVTQGTVRGFRFEYSIPSKMTAKDTLEFVRFPSRAKMISIIFENNFENVEFSINTLDGREILKSTENKVVEFMAPLDVAESSLYLKIISGKIKAGQAIYGVAQYVGV